MNANKPDIEHIRKYLNGELDARAMFELEREAHNDPFLADVIRGMELSDENHQPRLIEIDRLIADRVKEDKKRVVVLWKLWPVAASLLIALGIGGWFIFRQPPNLAVVNEPRKLQPDKLIVQPAPLVKRDSVQINGIAMLGRSKVRSAVTVHHHPRSAKVDTPPMPLASVMADQADTTKNNLLEKTAKKEVPALNNALAGRLASIQVNRFGGKPGADQNIKIRGSSPVAKVSGPLYVVDGIPIDADKISAIKPDDIKSMDVLKDASVLASFGPRAANGIVVITTKDKAKTLAEVTIIGYGTQKKTDLTGAVSTISGNKLNKDTSETVPVQTLQGKVAGLATLKQKSAVVPHTPRVITGKIVDENKNPLPGVMVKVNGKTISTVTDAKGNFKITVPDADNSVLDVAYIGYNTTQVKVKNKKNLEIAMLPSSNALAEVVVTGYDTNPREIIEEAHPAQGWSSYNDYLKNKARVTNGKTGVVKVQFTVAANGAVSDVQVIKSLIPEADKAAILLIENGPRWLGDKDGKAKQIKLRIRFRKME